jgi:NADH dehydrogenase FAD-containing subunit
MKDNHKILILGGGYAGVMAAQVNPDKLPERT